ncbi:MAG: TlpA family protein disulfide reductase [Corynebacteriales bacterium]|nr:TlpA family protein disulfide reductase [Mycobacteriales bacterium]
MKKFALSLLAVVLLAGCSAGAGAVDQQAGGDKRFVSGDGSVSTYPRGERKKAPNISGEVVGEGSFTLDEFAGKVVVINFWGQWCAPCRAEADDLIEVYEATKAQGVEFLGINVRDSEDRAAAFENTFDVPYESVFDPSGRVALGFRDTPPNAIPATIVLDREHRVATVFRKPLLAEDLEPVVAALAAE